MKRYTDMPDPNMLPPRRPTMSASDEYTPKTLGHWTKNWDDKDIRGFVNSHVAAWRMDLEHSDEYARLWHREADKVVSLLAENEALSAEVARLSGLLNRARGDIYWMLNNQKLLNPSAVEYLAAGEKPG